MINGTPWGIVYVKSTDGIHRHKAKCVYLVGKECSLIGKCCGSSHCEFYKEGFRTRIIEEKPIVGGRQIASVSKMFKTVGTRIYHKSTYSSQDGGFGTITEVMDGKVRIDFDDGTHGNFVFPTCLEFLMLVEEE